jgi:hypothetical protein
LPGTLHRHPSFLSIARSPAVSHGLGTSGTWTSFTALFIDGLAKRRRWPLTTRWGRRREWRGWITRFTQHFHWWDTWIIDGSIRLMSFLVKVASYPMRILQTGLVQAYALVFVLGVLGLFAWFLIH